MRGFLIAVGLVILIASSYMKGYGDGMEEMINRYHDWAEAMSQWVREQIERSRDGEKRDSGSISES